MPLTKTERGSPEGSEDLDSEERTGTMACLVCGDVATGRHYGTLGFFRRTIRRAYKYTCRFDGNCNIDKHNRAVCRACRFSRCIRFGMKVDAVQNERDLIGKRPRTHSQTSVAPPSVAPTGTISPPIAAAVAIDPWDCPKSLLELLMKSEEKIKNLRDSVIKETGKMDYTIRPQQPPKLNQNGRKATPNDILHSLHSQLLLVIEWAKQLRPFSELCTEDQTALLKNFASQHIVLCVAYRSINASDFLQLINDTCIPRVNVGGSDEGDDFYRKDCERVMDQLVAPMRYLNINDYEFVAMKACVLFNPVARGLSNESVMKVLDTRRRIFNALEHYVRTKTPVDLNRVGDLTFFILSPLQGLAKSISEDVLLTKMSGIAQIDLLMDELMLEDTEPKHHKHAMDLRRSLSETEPVSRATTESCSENTLTELRPMPVVPTTVSLVGSAPAQFNIEPSIMNASTTSEMSPINDYEMPSTLSSYVFGGTLQSPISPSNDIMFSSASTAPASADFPAPKLSNCSQLSGPISPPQQWTTLVPNPTTYEYPIYTSSYQPTYPPVAPTATPLNF
ncbi:Zinc finger and Nuclear hormone receptor domain containing protein [Aphelenchoides besseyi]|nr:Zinc finger and Nuclear hormone receptor domain containing protein [Aphelenchoides besseyi]